jgi:hypothetical protein
MSKDQACRLTTKDYTILEVMLERCHGRDDPMTPMLRRKLAEAVVMFREDIPADVVTLSSRVTYRVNGAPSETRIVSHDEMRGLVGSVLPITNPRGLALLGLAEGQSATIERPDGTTETIAVEAVAYQPEAARREAMQLAGSPARPVQNRPVLRIVHDSGDIPVRPAKTMISIGGGGFDDPGPSAA